MNRLQDLFENHSIFLVTSAVVTLIYSFISVMEAYIWSIPLAIAILAIWWLIPQWWLRPLVAGAVSIIPGMIELLTMPDTIGMLAMLGFFMLVPISAALGILILYAPSSEKYRWYHGFAGLFLYGITASIMMQILVFIF
jgi:hypothetical protein